MKTFETKTKSFTFRLANWKGIFVALFLSSVSLPGAFAQMQGTVKGQVVDASGEPVAGAFVSIPGTGNGTITDNSSLIFPGPKRP